MKQNFIWWVVILSIFLIGCSNTKSISKIEAESEIIAEPLVEIIPFIDWAAWKIVQEHGGPFNRITKRKHPFKENIFGIGQMKNGQESEVILNINGRCMYGSVQVLGGHPIFKFVERTECSMYDTLNDRFFLIP